MAVEFVERNKSGEFLFDVVRGNYLLGWIHSTGYEAHDDTIFYADELRAIADKLEELEREEGHG